ncbi:DMT family transporter [Desulfolutivibrio sulfoxidireducens]|uniref:DMT family transporter n=1 Tax=Desulfolutivibrio sulfoxidireducens TaxID=2773299 RepID=UPI00159E52E7|nr:DMT family transporter [Desulfolutivibrio sulfoxidireducens]QLA19347.1 EamA family transporter [Desulfolutivibrio sulfoxidireducens]
MRSPEIKADILLLVTALIWGLAFVAQRVGMDHVGPFTFNGVRFLLGAGALFPLALRAGVRAHPSDFQGAGQGRGVLVWGGLAAGAALFAGASLQQVGLVYTTAGKAGFITGLYVVIVPLFGLFFRQKSSPGDVFGAVMAAVGLYFLSVSEDLTMSLGDVLELAGAFFWAGHVCLIGWLSPKVRATRLACVQYAVCGVLSLATAFLTETVTSMGLSGALVPILYGGLLSVGLAYTLQVVAQRDAKPAHAAILLSLEAVFAALAGWALLGESMGARGMFGCGLMLLGMLASQLWPRPGARAA